MDVAFISWEKKDDQTVSQGRRNQYKYESYKLGHIIRLFEKDSERGGCFVERNEIRQIVIRVKAWSTSSEGTDLRENFVVTGTERETA